MASSTVQAAAADEQDRILDEASNNVKRHAFYMKKAIDDGVLDDVIKHASDMLYELRTGRLSPQNYYDLYISVTDELRYLESFFDDVQANAESSSRLYDIVQHAGNIIPRLYLLITAGSVCIRARSSPPMEVLFDLAELCKGVQHPTRGLFLRSYLSQVAKDNLPDISSEHTSSEKDVTDAIEFVLQNFAEVNRLWVRMQHQGANRDRSRRERERQNLRMLVGTNLVRLSQLESITLDTYKETVLPRILEQVVDCKDKIAQEYLMDCVIQVFPDEYHLATLETFLGSCSQLQSQVQTHDIIIALMNRLSNYALNSPDSMPSELEMFPLFKDNSKAVIAAKDNMPLSDILALQVALVNFASKVYTDRLSYVDDVLSFAGTVLSNSGSKIAPKKVVRHVVKLLSVPLEAVSIRVLDLVHYSEVLSFLDHDHQKHVANSLVKSILESGSALNNSQKLIKLLEYIQPLLRDENEGEASASPYEHEQEQSNVARLVHLISNEDTDQLYSLYKAAFQVFRKGGPSRLCFTMPALCFAMLRLTRRIFEREQREDELQTKSQTAFQFTNKCILTISSSHPELAVRLSLNAALASDRCMLEEVTYEFMTNAFIAYEEEIAHSKAQLLALTMLSGTMAMLCSLTEHNYDTLGSKITQHYARLLRKSDQVRGLCRCSHMFFVSLASSEAAGNKGCRVKSSLQRALKIAGSVLNEQEQAQIFVEILEALVHFIEKDVREITAEFSKTVVKLTETHLDELEDCKEARSIRTQFDAILHRITAKDTDGGGSDCKTSAVQSKAVPKADHDGSW